MPAKTQARKYVLAKDYEGYPTDENIVLQQEEIGELSNGEVLFEATYLSVDPYMRLFQPVGGTMIGEQVCRVCESKHPEYSVGALYQAKFGWRDFTKCNPDVAASEQYSITRLPDMGDLPASYALGAAGMPGETAHMGLLDKAELKEGDTVMVTGAAGAVGSVVGQISRIKNCTVVGCAGSDEKVAWLKKIGFTHAFNYKTQDLEATLKNIAPQGFNVFYDNVGGHIGGKIINEHMASGGRVVCVGTISGYNSIDPACGPYLMTSVLMKCLTIRGFIHFLEPPENILRAKLELIQWIREGKLEVREHVTEGFENMRSAFYGLFKGENTGKAIVKV